MTDPFIDCSTLEGQGRIRRYVLGWLERLDYSGKLDRSWPADELADRIWDRIMRDFEPAWKGPLVANLPLARVIATTMVEDYYSAYPERRRSRYSVIGPLPDAEFRRCVLDFIHDLEEYEPAILPRRAEAAVEAFWAAVRHQPDRWGCSAERGPFVDDEWRAHEVAVETVRQYFTLQRRAQRRRERSE